MFLMRHLTQDNTYLHVYFNANHPYVCNASDIPYVISHDDLMKV